jgi:hypothetical protein
MDVVKRGGEASVNGRIAAKGKWIGGTTGASITSSTKVKQIDYFHVCRIKGI